MVGSIFAEEAKTTEVENAKKEAPAVKTTKVDMGAEVANLNSAISSESKSVEQKIEDKRSAEEILSDVMEGYIDQNDLRDKYDYVGSAIGTSSQNQANSNYVDSAQLAFEKALIKAQAEYISFISANTKVDRTLSVDSTQGSDVNSIDTGSDKPKEGTQEAVDSKETALKEAKAVKNKLKKTGDIVHCVVPNTITYSGGLGKNKIHPTQKPQEILEYFISLCSNKGDMIMDTFAGSGSTGKAAEKLDRNYILIERDKKMFDKMNDRFDQQFDLLFE